MTDVLVVAGLSARMLAQSARAAAYGVDAIDLFGDLDTRAAASHWSSAGVPAGLEFDGRRLLGALAAAASRHAPARVVGWVAGNGFEGRPDLLQQGQAVLPLLGNSADTVRRVRDPATFFERLRALGIPQPELALEPPRGEGWLVKDAGSSGGLHVERFRHALQGAEPRPGSRRYFQREVAGEPMSALFLADGRRACMLGFSRQLVAALGERPFVHRGCVGPVALPAAVAQRLAGLLDALVEAFELRGLNSLDFLLAGDEFVVLELNPRPSASMAVHEAAPAGGLMAAHVAACSGHGLASPADVCGVRGFELLFAPRDVIVTLAQERAMAARAWCHDRPAAYTRIGCEQPLCSVSASAADETSLMRLLAQRRTEILALMERQHDRSERRPEHAGT